ncbi:MAG: hypothetical protein ABSG97_06060 [Sedimentisphaerales bacterium]|jgi:hypothetical protein
MTISEKQLQANRINALKGGVKTQEGEEIVRYNALKHGLLAKEAVVHVGEYAENPEEFKALLHDLMAKLKPVGHMELVLTKNIAVFYWQLRRAYRYEVQLIGKTSDNSIEDFSNKTECCNPEPGQINEGIDNKTAHMKDDIENLQKGKADFLQLCKEDIHELIDEIRQNLVEVEEEIRDFLESCDEDEKNVEEKIAILERQTHGLRYKRKRHIINILCGFPSKEELWLLLRYEGAIERHLYKAIKELEELQGIRSGDDIPLPLENEEVDEDTEDIKRQNEFVLQHILRILNDSGAKKG